VDIEHRLKLLVGHSVDDSVPGVTGVVDHGVHLAEGIHRGFDHVVGRGRRGQVSGEHGRFALDLIGGLLRDVPVEVVDQHLGSLADEQLRRRPADAPGRAGDDRALSVKQSQVRRLLVVGRRGFFQPNR
jgi:hypothetical protein